MQEVRHQVARTEGGAPTKVRQPTQGNEAQRDTSSIEKWERDVRLSADYQGQRMEEDGTYEDTKEMVLRYVQTKADFGGFPPKDVDEFLKHTRQDQNFEQENVQAGRKAQKGKAREEARGRVAKRRTGLQGHWLAEGNLREGRTALVLGRSATTAWRGRIRGDGDGCGPPATSRRLALCGDSLGCSGAR